ncbi:MAG: GNAT family N-acetyltransferase [Chloroflexales bacterium]|nr:GNAT family N-acetyltransferase [Chloroflexales bacterium]
MSLQPTLKTQRLILRPFTLDDAPEVQRLAASAEVARTTLNIPHPYEDGMAEAWINTHQPAFEAGTHVTFAITHRTDAVLFGAIGFGFNLTHQHAEMGYWIGMPHWNQGYATEAARMVLTYAFIEYRLHRLYAHHFKHNPASGRVLQKIGMQYEGCLRQHIYRWGEFADVVQYGILRSEWISAQTIA